MRSNKSEDEFFMKMKKKPALQDILDNLENINYDDIDKLSQPLWIKNQLKKLKTGDHEFDPKYIAKLEASATSMEHKPLLFKNKLEMRQWDKDDTWIKTERIEILVNPNDYFLILNEDDNLVLWLQSACRISDWEKFINGSKRINFVTKKEYNSLISQPKTETASKQPNTSKANEVFDLYKVRFN